MRPWPTRTAYYSHLADAFLHGQLFLLAGLYCAWRGLDALAAAASDGVRRHGAAWLTAAGACAAAAVGCRISLVPAVAALAAAVLLRLVPRAGSPWRPAAGAAA